MDRWEIHQHRRTITDLRSKVGGVGALNDHAPCISHVSHPGPSRGRRHQHLVLHARRIWQLLDPLFVVSRDAGRGPQHDRSGRAGGDQRGLGARNLGQSLPNRAVQLTDIHVSARRFGHGIEHLRWHQASPETRHMSRGVDTSPQAQPFVDARGAIDVRRRIPV